MVAAVEDELVPVVVPPLVPEVDAAPAAPVVDVPDGEVDEVPLGAVEDVPLGVVEDVPLGLVEELVPAAPPVVEVPPLAPVDAPDELGAVRLVITRTSFPGPACSVSPGNPMMRSPEPVPVTVAVADCATSILVMPPLVLVVLVPEVPVVPLVPLEPDVPEVPPVVVVAIALTPAKFVKLPVKTPGAPPGS